MSLGNGIIVSSEPRGRFIEGIVSGTPLPGTMMQLVAGTAKDGNGLWTWQVWQLATGAAGLQAILMEDYLQGMPVTQAYVTGSRIQMYVPLPGELCNCFLADVAGTGDVHTQGDLLGVQTATGKLVVNSSFASTPWTCMETIPAPTADTLVLCMRN